jgi:acetyl-CoA carboxylase biotin carboxyl carrier protein
MPEKLSPNKELIRELSDLLEETGLTEIEWAEGQTRVRVGRSPAPVAAFAPTPSMTLGHETTAAEPPSHPGAVTSPVVGTAYVAPEPGAEPFVQVGDSVSEGQTLLIIEAMKTMNPIPAPRGGTVRQILFSDGAPVEYGEILLIIE